MTEASSLRTIELIPVTPDLEADTIFDALHFEWSYNVQLGVHADLVFERIHQSRAWHVRTGAPPEWGGFLCIAASSRHVVGTCAFVNAPDVGGRVEIAYGTLPTFERQGYATAMAAALVKRAAASPEVRTVFAHTLPEINASTRLLARLGFTQVGTGHDVDAGPIWVWELPVHVGG